MKKKWGKSLPEPNKAKCPGCGGYRLPVVDAPAFPPAAQLCLECRTDVWADFGTWRWVRLRLGHDDWWVEAVPYGYARRATRVCRGPRGVGWQVLLANTNRWHPVATFSEARAMAEEWVRTTDALRRMDRDAEMPTCR